MSSDPINLLPPQDDGLTRPRLESALDSAATALSEGNWASFTGAIWSLRKHPFHLCAVLVFFGGVGLAYGYVSYGKRVWSFAVAGFSSDRELDAVPIDPDDHSTVGVGIRGHLGENRLTGDLWMPFLDWVKRRQPNSRVLILQELDNLQVAYGVYSMAQPGDGPTEVQFPAGTNGFAFKGAVYFGFDEEEITPDEKIIIADVVQLLKTRRDLAVLVQGHADRRGTSSYNARLGARRAQAVTRELLQLGIPRSRIYQVTFGKTKLKEPGDSEQDHLQNRRVDFVLLPLGQLR